MHKFSAARRVTSIFLQGLATLLPIVLTFYVIFWLMHTAESMMGQLVKTWIHESAYLPGMGIAVGIAGILGLGMLMQIYVFRRIVRAWEALMARIPLVKTIFSAIRDTMVIFARPSAGQQAGQVVAVDIGEQRRLLGFITRDQCDNLPSALADKDYVAVYLPMSYQIGGYTLYMPRDAVKALDMDLETGMRLAVTAGLGTQPTEPEG